MDDFILLLETKHDCIKIKKNIEDFLWNNLHLELNSKSRYYPSSMGVNFCGYRIFPTHRLLRRSSKSKIKRKIKKWNKQFHNNTMQYSLVLQSLNSWIAHSSHCNSYKLQKKILNSCDFLINDHFYENVEKSLISEHRDTSIKTY